MSNPDPEHELRRLTRVVRERLAKGQQVRRNLPGWGRLAVDRPLPFLVVYRRPSRSKDRATSGMITSEASYLICSAEQRLREPLSDLAAAVAETQTARFGAFLILEVWAGKRGAEPEVLSTGSVRTAFSIYAPVENGHEALTDSFEQSLRRIKLGRQTATVDVVKSKRRWPRGWPPIIPADVAERAGCLVYGLEVDPVFRDPESGEPYPRVLREVRRRLSVSLRRFFHDFATSNTTADPAHFHALGRRAVVKAVWEVDNVLANAAESFDFLLQLTPVNGEQAWAQFQRRRFQRAPPLHYRPILVDPVVLKRRLFKAPVERIEDPALAIVFREKLNELDRQITMLHERNSSRFLRESIQLFGGVEDNLYEQAIDILKRIRPRSREEKAGGFVDADSFAERARDEIAFLRAQRPQVNAEVEVRADITGLLVSHGKLLVSSGSNIPKSRVEALIQHEVGTHVLTYHNGCAQKLRLLSAGLAGYDALQEGLAVLAEYLVGGLSRPRLRLLAGRVVAARCLLDGASFVDTFRELSRTHGFANRVAFTITVRTFRSGGLTKDAVYLRGLRKILDYIGGGGELEPLFVGKIAVRHIPIIRELTWRNVLVQPPLIPRYMEQPDAMRRLRRLQKGAAPIDLLKRTTR